MWLLYAAGALLVVAAGSPWLCVRLFAVRRGPITGCIALTVDDGPNPDTTPALLEALEKHTVPATFFCIGEKLERHQALGHAIAAAGHELCNHSYRHAHLLATWRVVSAERELRKAQAVLTSFGSTSRYFRAVAGVLSPPLYRAARRAGLVPVHWTASARDGGPLPVTDALALRRLRKGLVPGGILVIHDRAQVAHLIGPLRELADARGLRFVTLDALLTHRKSH